MIKNKYSTDFANAALDEQGVAQHSGWAVAYCSHPVTREYLCATMEFLCAGVRLPAFSYGDKPVLPGKNMALVRSLDGAHWEAVADLRGQTAYRISDGVMIRIDFLTELPPSMTLLAPLKSTDLWDGDRWMDASLVTPHLPLAANLPLLLK
ncbi:tail fiber assembly protein [Acerihabitans arboris]|uniref:Tail fiber assembly protein n=1 Tax=Acerihabitans arboris TaxID=2691583 RepID=A0A845SKW4_9GAMM|nr:tail fiber assembly protein [Acerihabitans arboris]NDL61945.1 tail fiber assembly protein [Acerihabitans arboris]